jgi:hypothetical protein
MRKVYRGEYCGLTATTISSLMGCSLTRAIKDLFKMKKGNPEFTLEDIGKIIYEYRCKPNKETIDDLLNRWTGPNSL